jgi:protein involved in polysaccharide export with SLBB domain
MHGAGVGAALLALLALPACKNVARDVGPAGGIIAPPPDNALFPVEPMPYTLVPGDEIAIRVLHAPELENFGIVRLDTDGRIQFPYIGPMKLEGLTTADVRRRIAMGLRDWYVDPIVTVNLVSQQQQFVRVIGEASREGLYPIQPGMTIIDAVTQAGGLTFAAAQNRVVLIRRVAEDEVRAGFFDYRAATLNPIGSGAWANNLPLRSGDTIFIPRNQRAQWEAVFGFINTMFGAGVTVERSIILYPDAKHVLRTGEREGRTTVIVR